MLTSELLTKAKTLISDPQKWTQGESWRDKDGKPTDRLESVTCMCSYGALAFVVDNEFENSEAYADASSTLRAALRMRGDDPGLAIFNDTHPHAEVMTLWDEAIELAKRFENDNA